MRFIHNKLPHRSVIISAIFTLLFSVLNLSALAPSSHAQHAETTTNTGANCCQVQCPVSASLPGALPEDRNDEDPVFHEITFEQFPNRYIYEKKLSPANEFIARVLRPPDTPISNCALKL